MSVSRRKTSKGFTGSFHYRFYHSGKTYSGVCEGCLKKSEALDYEKAEREKIITGTAAIRNKKQTRRKAEKIVSSIIVTEPVNDIPLGQAFAESLKKPKKRKATGDFLHAKESYWRDFVAFMADKFSGVETIRDVERKHADAYISYIREHGRFQKIIEWNGGRSYKRKGNYSNKTCNVIHDSLKEVFKLLMDEADQAENPFAKIEKLDNESTTREPFTEDELKNIFKNTDSFLYPIFAIGISTALREGDICTLRWKEIDFQTNIIQRRALKTRKIVEIPIMAPLRNFLLELKTKSDGDEYVLPEHAFMYMNNRTGISARVKKFLEALNITTTKKVPGRTRKVSVKDVHSLRHSFCFYAGLYGIPLLVVKSIVGHMTDEMTAHYQRHADNKTKREQMLQMPDLMNLSGSTRQLLPVPDLENTRAQLILLANTSTDIEKIRQAIAIFNTK